MSKQATRYDMSANVCLTYDDTMEEWAVITGVLHPYGLDVVRYPSYSSALNAYRLTVEEARA
jgi:hypothetical protein